MEEKERYSYDYFIDGAVFIDTENDHDMDMDTVCSLLNKQDQQIADLEAKLAESERKNFELLTKLNLKEYAPAFCTLADRDCEALGQIEELKQQLEEKEKDNQFFKKMYLSEKQKNDNYHTKKYGLDKPVEELRKIKLNSKEKEIYYKGFDNCERQFATHIAELEQQLKSQPAEIVEKIRKEVEKEKDENDLAWVGFKKLDRILDTILKEYQK